MWMLPPNLMNTSLQFLVRLIIKNVEGKKKRMVNRNNCMKMRISMSGRQAKAF